MSDYKENVFPKFGLWAPFIVDYFNDPYIKQVTNLTDAIQYVLTKKVNRLIETRKTLAINNIIDIGVGDLLYHSWYRFGHTSIARSFTINLENNEVYQHITDCGAQIWSAGSCANQSLIYNPQLYQGSITRIRYIGENAQFYRYAVAILADYLGQTGFIHHGGLTAYCNYVKNSCYGIVSFTQEKRLKTIYKIIEKYYESIFNAEINAQFICSTMGIVLWQLVFMLYEPELIDEYLPVNADGCIPKDINTLAKKFPNGWHSTTIVGFNQDIYDNLHFAYDNHNGIYIFPNFLLGGRLLTFLLPSILKNEVVIEEEKQEQEKKAKEINETIGDNSENKSKINQEFDTFIEEDTYEHEINIETNRKNQYIDDIKYSRRQVEQDLMINYNLQVGACNWINFPTDNPNHHLRIAATSIGKKDWKPYWYPSMEPFVAPYPNWRFEQQATIQSNTMYNIMTNTQQI